MDAVRTYASKSLFASFTLYFLFVFMRVGRFIQGEVSGRVLFSKTSDPLAQWFRVLAAKPLTKVFLESFAVLFFYS